MIINIQQKDKTISLYYTQKTLLSTAVKESGLQLNMPCNGKGTCGKCLVYATGALSQSSEQELKLLQGKKDMRLACMTYATGDCKIVLQQQNSSILEQGELPDYQLHPVGTGYGFAVDIGTTTVVVYLYNLENGQKLEQASFANPQSVFGGDVISRIQESINGNGPKLQTLISSKLEETFSALCERRHLRKEQITDAVVTGNTTMLYLLCGREVEPLSHAPFAITEYFGKEIDAEQAGIHWPGPLRVYLPQTMAAFVGSDITCALLSSRLCRGGKPCLLVDIGTNGEMGIAHQGKLACCSTAAGPAFEGAGIVMGSPAVKGAIDRVFVRDGVMDYTTIQQGEATGICGSGLIDAMAALVETGLVDETGYIDEESPLAQRYITEYEGEAAVKIGESGVVLTQKDIRAVQLAKAAICAGIDSLIHQCGLTVGDVDRLLLAGGFGSYIDCQSAGTIGLIPAGLAEKAHSVGNAAGMGAILLLLSQEEREESLSLARNAEILDLSTSPYFMEKYVACMTFGAEEEA